MLNGRGIAGVVIGSILLSVGLILAGNEVCFGDCDGCCVRLAVFILLLGGLSLGLGLGLGRGSSGLNSGGVAGVVLCPVMVTFGVAILVISLLARYCSVRPRESCVGLVIAVILLVVGGVALGLGVGMGRGRGDEGEPEVPITLIALEAAFGAVAVAVIIGYVIYARSMMNKKVDQSSDEHEGEPVRG
jgi:hypothetical protein